MNRPVTTIAAIHGLVGFGVSAVSGLASDVSPEMALVRCLVSMSACYVIGLFVGTVGRHVAESFVREYQIGHPIPGAENRGNSAGAARMSAGGTDAAVERV